LLFAQMGFAATIHILDWNIDRGYDLDKIAEVIRAQNTDVAILQEVDLNARRTNRADVAKELAQKLGLEYAFGKAWQEVNQGGSEDPAYQGQATLSRYPIGKQRIVEFSHQTGFWKPQPYLPSWFPQRRLGGRIALVTELDVGSRKLVVYNLHLESRGPGYNRFEQLKETLADAKNYADGTAIVLAGDLNTKYFPSHFVSLLEAAGFHDCFDGRRQKTHKIIGTLDWIFVRGPVKWEETKVVHHTPVSDHYPVATRLVLP
jgi:endonuclease/exonuclease/phosphatase family metal-dependent hydrolase